MKPWTRFPHGRAEGGGQGEGSLGISAEMLAPVIHTREMVEDGWM